MGRDEEIERLEETIIVLEASIKRREMSRHPEKYVNCLENDRYLLKKYRKELAELKESNITLH